MIPLRDADFGSKQHESVMARCKPMKSAVSATIFLILVLGSLSVGQLKSEA